MKHRRDETLHLFLSGSLCDSSIQNAMIGEDATANIGMVFSKARAHVALRNYARRSLGR